MRLLTARGAVTDSPACAGRWRLKTEARRAFRALDPAGPVRRRYVATVGTLETAVSLPKGGAR